MGRISRAETNFTKRFPHASCRIEKNGCLTRYTVYAGDYICSEALTRGEAFQRALEYVDAGIITPDPNEERAL